MQPSKQPTNRPTSRPTSQPLQILQRFKLNNPSPAVIAALIAALPAALIAHLVPGCSLGSIVYLCIYSDDSINKCPTAGSRFLRSDINLQEVTVTGIQVNYIVYSPPSVSGATIASSLSDTATISAISSSLADSPGLTGLTIIVQAPVVTNPTNSPTPAPSALPTFAATPTAAPSTVITTTGFPTVESNTFATPTASPTSVNTVIASQVWQHTLLYTKILCLSLTDTFFGVWLSVSQYVTSASLTVAQAQSSTFTTAFVAGIQSAMPGVTVTVNSVSAARRRLLASVVVSYSASSATASTSALISGLSSSTTIAAVTSSLVVAGYAGVVVTNLVVSTPITTGTGSTSPSAGGSGADTTVGAIAGGVIGGLLVLAVGGSLFHIVHVTKSHQWNGCKLQKIKHKVGLQENYVGGEQPPERWAFFNPPNVQPISLPREGVAPVGREPLVGETDSVVPRLVPTVVAGSDAATAAAVGYTVHVDDVSGLTYFVDSAGTTARTRPGELLPGWTAELDPFTGKMFYRHDTSNVVSLEKPPGKDTESSTLTLPNPRVKMAINNSGATTSGQRYEPNGTAEEKYDELTTAPLTDIYSYVVELFGVTNNTMDSGNNNDLKSEGGNALPPSDVFSQSFHYSEKQEATNDPIVSASLRNFVPIESSHCMVDATHGYPIDNVYPSSTPSSSDPKTSEFPSLPQNKFRAPRVYVPDSKSSEFPSLSQNKFRAPRVHVPVESRYFDVTYGYANDEEADVSDGKLPTFPADVIPPSSSPLKSPQKNLPTSVPPRSPSPRPTSF